MASSIEVQSFSKRCKYDSVLNDEESHRNELFPVIDNLEDFPGPVLERIFTGLDDLGLLNVASCCTRFEAIAHLVFAERYADKYFAIDPRSKRYREIISAQIRCFGKHIKAVSISFVKQMGKDHWIAELMQIHCKNVEKLSFYLCSFKDASEFFAQYQQITHLSIRRSRNLQRCFVEIRLPQYRNLRYLELEEFGDGLVEIVPLKEIVLTNPQLESLILRFCGQYDTFRQLIDIVPRHLKQLREFTVVESFYFLTDFPSDSVEQFLTIMENLEKLGICFQNDNSALRCNETIGLMGQIGARCKNISHLDLIINKQAGHVYDNSEFDMISRSFPMIETLSIFDLRDAALIQRIIANMPRLRILKVSQWSFGRIEKCFALVRACKTLEKIEFESEHYEEMCEPYRNINLSFHEAFMESIQNRNVRLGINRYGDIIGIITRDEVVWMNKLVHRVGFAPMYNQSSLNLLDLTKPQEEAKTGECNALNRILEYLDLDSLYKLSLTCMRAKQLVESHMQEHSSRGKKFYIYGDFNFDVANLHTFGALITNLDASCQGINGFKLRNLLKEHFSNVRTLIVRAETMCDPEEFLFEPVRHYAIYSNSIEYDDCNYSCNLTRLSEKCPDLETMVFGKVVRLWASNKRKPHSFRQLKLFKFKPWDESQVQYARELFQGMGTQVIIDEECGGMMNR